MFHKWGLLVSWASLWASWKGSWEVSPKTKGSQVLRGWIISFIKLQPNVLYNGQTTRCTVRWLLRSVSGGYFCFMLPEWVVGTVWNWHQICCLIYSFKWWFLEKPSLTLTRSRCGTCLILNMSIFDFLVGSKVEMLSTCRKLLSDTQLRSCVHSNVEGFQYSTIVYSICCMLPELVIYNKINAALDKVA